jgi:hypothetical protein
MRDAASSKRRSASKIEAANGAETGKNRGSRYWLEIMTISYATDCLRNSKQSNRDRFAAAFHMLIRGGSMSRS